MTDALRTAARGPARPARAMRPWLGLGVGVLLAALLIVQKSMAESSRVPAELQARLLARLAFYDRNFATRAGPTANVLIVALEGDPDSTRAATEMKGALGGIPEIGNLPHTEQIVAFTSADALAERVRSQHAAIVYLGPGFEKHAAAIREAMTPLNILTVGTTADYVPPGIVLGFDLVSGHPKLVINITQARKQQVDFQSSALKLMRIVE